MTKFRMTWVMEIMDDELLDLVNDYQTSVEEDGFEDLKDVPEDLMLKALEDSTYISEEISGYLDPDMIEMELMPNEEV